MLLVLSEIDCLGYLQQRGVYPDEFFTDFEMFKNKIVVHSDVDALVIFAGSCSFGKRILQEYILSLEDRAKDESDGGINSVCVLSDIVLPKLSEYYRYIMYLENAVRCSHWESKKGVVNILEKYEREQREAKVFLRRVDRAKLSETLRRSRDKDDELLDIIQVPTFVSR